MKRYQQVWSERVVQALDRLYPDASAHDISNTITVETPPDLTKGDIAFPMFPLARVLRAAPQAIAAAVAGEINDTQTRVEAIGPYVNVYLDRSTVGAEIVNMALENGASYGTGNALAGLRVMIEFSSPNTNKPLHLGHLRNDAIGESVSRMLAAAGAEVYKVNLINDRGVHICKSMLAYQEYGDGATPESTGVKSDHFVGNYYVRYAEWEKQDPTIEERAREMLAQWERGDAQTRELWEEMNRWAIEGISETYRRTGISFDKTYFESDTYMLGRDRILAGLDDGVFYRDEKGTIWVDLTDIDLDKKVVMRADGTSLYLTQDIGTALQRSEDWPFDRLLFVVATEQRYHFQVLFEVMRRLGVEWADNLFHLAYGMVNLPDGKMKSREGTVVDADDLIDELASMAKKEIIDKGRESHLDDVEATAEKIALAALHYYLLQTGPIKDMVFDPSESLSFTGNTGPYLQYVGARISSMLAKRAIDGTATARAPESDEEWRLMHLVAGYPDQVANAALSYNPSVLTNYLFDLAKTFSRFYHDHPIAVAEDPEVRNNRLALSGAVINVMKNGLSLLNIPFVEAM